MTGTALRIFISMMCAAFGFLMLIVCFALVVWRLRLRRRRSATGGVQGVFVAQRTHHSPDAPPPYVPSVGPHSSDPPPYTADSVNYPSSTSVWDAPTPPQTLPQEVPSPNPSDEDPPEYLPAGSSQEESQPLMTAEQ